MKKHAVSKLANKFKGDKGYVDVTDIQKMYGISKSEAKEYLTFIKRLVKLVKNKDPEWLEGSETDRCKYAFRDRGEYSQLSDFLGAKPSSSRDNNLHDRGFHIERTSHILVKVLKSRCTFKGVTRK